MQLASKEKVAGSGLGGRRVTNRKRRPGNTEPDAFDPSPGGGGAPAVAGAAAAAAQPEAGSAYGTRVQHLAVPESQPESLGADGGYAALQGGAKYGTLGDPGGGGGGGPTYEVLENPAAAAQARAAALQAEQRSDAEMIAEFNRQALESTSSSTAPAESDYEQLPGHYGDAPTEQTERVSAALAAASRR